MPWLLGENQGLVGAVLLGSFQACAIYRWIKAFVNEALSWAGMVRAFAWANNSGVGWSFRDCAAARAWCCPASRVQGWRHAGRLGMLAGSNVGWALAAANDAGVVVGLRDREMGQGGMAAPGCVQSRSVGGPSSMGPPSSSVRSTTEVFRLVMLGGREKSTTVGTRKSNDECWRYSGQRPCMQLCMGDFFLFRPGHDTDLKTKKRWAKCLLIRPREARLFLYWPACRCANGARFFFYMVRRLHGTRRASKELHRLGMLKVFHGLRFFDSVYHCFKIWSRINYTGQNAWDDNKTRVT